MHGLIAVRSIAISLAIALLVTMGGVSTATAAGTLTAPVPTLNGTVKVGSKLTATPGTWKPAPVTLKFQWLRSGTAISGATASSYTLAAADVAKTISVKVTGSKSGYTSASKTSKASVVVLPGTLTAPVPTVSGTAKVGYKLTSAPGTWTTGTALKYQWLRAGAVITGATASGYTLTAAELSKTISVRVTGTKTGYAAASKTSKATVGVAAGSLTASAPTITGAAPVHSSLTAVPGSWTSGTMLKYAWLRNGTAISGATKTTYTLLAADVGKKISVRVTGSKTGYVTVSKTSIQVGSVPEMALTGATPVIAGTPIQGEKLVASAGTWTTGTALSYQWLRDGAAISGAMASTYVPMSVDADSRLSVRVAGKRPGYTTMTKISALTLKVPTASTPTIVGTAKVGSVLIVQPGIWTSGMAFTYSWRRDGVVIGGATTPTYKLTETDMAKKISVTVTGAKPGYPSVAKTSATIGAAITDVLHVGGALGKDTTWSPATAKVIVVDSNLAVPAGVTLRIEAGTVVKFSGASARLDVTGALQIAGTAASPVILTSIRDDTAGGDTNEDGVASSPTGVEWGGISANRGTLTISQLRQRFGDGVSVWPDVKHQTTITESTFSGPVLWDPFRWWGMASPDSWAPSFTFVGNTVLGSYIDVGDLYVPSRVEVRDNIITPATKDSLPIAFSVASGALRPSLLVGNSSTRAAVFRVKAKLSENWGVGPQTNLTWFADFVETAEYDVTIPAGTVMGSGYWKISGGFDASGEPDRPVVLKPLWGARDDYDSGYINLDNARSFRAAHLDLVTSMSTSEFEDWRKVLSGSYKVLDVTDSTLQGPVSVKKSGAGSTRFDRNTLTGGGLSINTSWSAWSGAGTEGTTTSIAGNLVDAGADGEPAYNISLGLENPRDFLSNTSLVPDLFELQSQITDAWLLPKLSPGLEWSPRLSSSIGGKLTVTDDTPLHGGYLSAEGGELHLQGEESKPLLLDDVRVNTTSSQYGEESFSYQPKLVAEHVVFRGNAANIDAYGSGTALLDNVTFENHGGNDACVTIDKRTTGHLRGDLSACHTGIVAFGGFDARNSKWGSSDGPSPIGTGTIAIGDVMVTPWIGYQRVTCQSADYIVLAVRGSGEVPAGPVGPANDPTLYDAFSYREMTESSGQEFRGLGPKIQGILTGQTVDNPGAVSDHGDGLLDSLKLPVDSKVLVEPLVYTAASTELLKTMIRFEPNWNPVDGFGISFDPTKLTEYLTSINYGIDKLRNRLSQIHTECPNAKVVLAGYSQGAMVIHMAMSTINDIPSDRPQLDKISAILLLADPLQNVEADGGTQLGNVAQTPGAPNRGLIDIITGPVYQMIVRENLNGNLDALNKDYPQQLADRTLYFCDFGDLMCAPNIFLGLDQMTSAHTGYLPYELTQFGRAAEPFMPAR